MARPKSARDQPVSASIGNWKKPIAERGPKVKAAMRQPLAMISQGNPGSLLDSVAVLIPSSPLGPQTRKFIPLHRQRQAGKCARYNSVPPEFGRRSLPVRVAGLTIA